MINLANITTLVISGIYYAAVAVLTLLSSFAVYILLRYGKNRALSLIVCVLYCLVFLSLIAQSYQNLQGL